MSEMHAVEPAHGIRLKLQVFRMGQRRERRMAKPDGIQAPANQDHDHHSRELHDAHCFLAGFGNALDVVPPEIKGNENGEERGASSRRDLESNVEIVEGFVEETDDVLTGRYATDW